MFFVFSTAVALEKLTQQKIDNIKAILELSNYKETVRVTWENMFQQIIKVQQAAKRDGGEVMPAPREARVLLLRRLEADARLLEGDASAFLPARLDVDGQHLMDRSGHSVIFFPTFSRLVSRPLVVNASPPPPQAAAHMKDAGADKKNIPCRRF